jgi:hypothetical protein
MYSYGRPAMTQFNTNADWKERGFRMRTPPIVLVCYDPAGDGDDRDALVMVERQEHQFGEPWDPDFAVNMRFMILLAHQMARSLEFPDKLGQILSLHRSLCRWRNLGRTTNHIFCVETNGVGYAMGSSLRSRISANVVTYTTVGNVREEPYADHKVTMPRLASLDNLRVLSETHSLKIAKGAPGADIVVREMSSFVWRRPGRPEALQGQHDDVVMALAGACWIGSKLVPPVLRAKQYRPGVSSQKLGAAAIH